MMARAAWGLSSFLLQQGGGDTWLNWIIMLLFLGVMNYYAGKLQVQVWMNDIMRALGQLERYTSEAENSLIEEASRFGLSRQELSKRVRGFKSFFEIAPVTLDPAGAIRRLEHILDVERDRFKRFVRSIAPNADDDKLMNLTDQLAGVIMLDRVYRIVRHYFLLGKKTQNLIYIAQIQMMIPEILRIAKAYWKSADAFRKGVPVGDSVGPLVALRLLDGAQTREIAEDVIYGEVDVGGRRVLVVKSKGPGGRLGKPGEAIGRLVDMFGGRIRAIIMVDAAAKLEGEETGEVAEGVGAAIGDPGPEKWKIEEVAARAGIDLISFAVKMSPLEALTPMTREVDSAADEVISRIRERIESDYRPGDVVIVAGIGNTVGVGNEIPRGGRGDSDVGVRREGAAS